MPSRERLAAQVERSSSLTLRSPVGISEVTADHARHCGQVALNLTPDQYRKLRP